MKAIRGAGLAVMAASAILAISVWAGGSHEAQNPASTVPADLLKSLDQVRGVSHKLFESAGAEEVARARVPDNVIQAADEWIKRVVRPELLPEDPAASLTAEIRELRFVPPEKVDLLRLEWQKADVSFCIVEGAANVAILWHSKDIRVGEEPQGYAVGLAKRLLMIPDNVAPQLTASLEPTSGEGTKVLHGYLSVPKSEDQKYLVWYNSMRVWVSDGYFYVAVPENTGRPPDRLQPRPGGARRFL